MMNVNFNNLRVQAAYRYDDLVKALNNGIQSETVHHYPSNSDNWVSGNILIDVEDIQDVLDDLRTLIISINGVYEPGNEDFKDMLEDIEKNGGLGYFNPESDE